jgi:hypothetical protein
MLSLKTDMKHQQHTQEQNSKRSRMLIIDPPTSVIPTTTITSLTDRINSSTMMTNWQTTNLKTYEDSPGLIFR